MQDEMAQAQTQRQGARQAAGPSHVRILGNSLYVGDLTPNVTEDQLSQIFRDVAPVVSIRVCRRRDLMTQRLISYAYVRYNTVEEATRALEILNFTPVNGRAIRVMFSDRDDSGRNNAMAKVYVKNLEMSIDSKALFDIFSCFGSISLCQVPTYASGHSKGYGIIQFEMQKSAASAIEDMNGKLLKDKHIFVSPFVSRHDRNLSEDASNLSNVFVKNISKSMTEEELANYFRAYGTISNAAIVRDTKGKSRGFGFVKFECVDAAARAIKALNGRTFDSVEWYVEIAHTKSEHSKGYGFIQFEMQKSAASAIEDMNGKLLKDKHIFVSPFVSRHDRNLSEDASNLSNVFVKNISKSMTEEELANYFRAYGTISNAAIVRDTKGKSRGFGFVKFECVDAAARAIKALNGRTFDSVEWYVEIADTKSEREAELRQNLEKSEKYPFNLFLTNLAYTIDEQRIKQLFAEFGEITSCKVLRDEMGRSRCFGFVAFSTAMAADAAISGMSGRMVLGRPLYVARAENEEKRRASKLQGYRILATPEAHFIQTKTHFGMDAPKAPLYDRVGGGIGEQSIHHGEHSSRAFIPSQSVAFSNQRQMPAGITPRGREIPNFDVPNRPRHDKQAQYQRGQGSSHGHGAPQQQTVLRGANRSYHLQNAMTTSDVAKSSMLADRRLDIPSLEIKAVPGNVHVLPSGVRQPSYRSALTSSFASAPPEEQRATLGSSLGRQIYPMVEKLEHDHAEIVTGMLLQLDQAEVLYLMEYPEALEAKVFESMEILRLPMNLLSELNLI